MIVLAQRSTELQAYRARVAWQSENIDVALIKLLNMPSNRRPSYTVPKFGSLNPNRPPVNCYGRGFPEASSADVFDDDYQFDGTAVLVSTRPRLDITVTAHPFAAGMWSGISGAAVFSADRLIGVIRAANSRWAGAVLQAVPIATIIEIPEIKALLFGSGILNSSVEVLGNDHRILNRPTDIFSRRVTLENIILPKLVSAQKAKSPLAIIIRGPQGAGKTTLADDICDMLCCSILQVSTLRNPDPSTLPPADLVFFDGFMDDASPVGPIDAGYWLRAIRTSAFLFTVRTLSATENICRVLEPKGFYIDEIEIKGLSESEFVGAIATCVKAANSSSFCSVRVDHVSCMNGPAVYRLHCRFIRVSKFANDINDRLNSVDRINV